jgi:anti-sigma regulatory factor (Ser/Thr protein kinase)/ketosteroid isomerase-like protein
VDVDEATRLATELIDAVNARDVDRALALMHPDAVLTPLVVQTGVVGEPYRGTAKIREYFDSFSQYWGDADMRLLGVHVVDDVVVSFCDTGVPGGDERLAITYVGRLDGDRLRELVSFADLARAGEALHAQRTLDLVRPLDVVLPATAASVPVARHALGAMMEAIGASEALQAQAALAVSEAATNAVIHAYRETADEGTLHLHAVLDGTTLSVSVEDEGCGLKPRPDSPGLGLGISLMTHQASEVAFVVPPQRPAGTEVRLLFDLAA